VQPTRILVVNVDLHLLAFRLGQPMQLTLAIPHRVGKRGELAIVGRLRPHHAAIPVG
jgi:hypothetical protein